MHLHGELERDAAVHYTTSGKAVVNLTVVTRYEKWVEYHKVTAWETLAEKSTELKKGDWVKIVGRLQTRTWADKASGLKRYATEIVAYVIALPSDDPPPLVPDQTKESRTGGTKQAKAILSPAIPEKNIHGIEIGDDDVPF
jgi:single stranded DNA-binding protein